MKVRLSQVVALSTYSQGYFSMNKEFESNIVPHCGDKITDYVWKEPYEYEVIEVIISYVEDVCYVTLEPIRFEHNNKEVIKEWHEMVKSHGWNPGTLIV